MTPDMVMEHLKSYKQCSGRCAHLEIQIGVVKRQLATLQKSGAEDAAYHVQQYENMDMPRGTDVGRPTEDIALRYCGPVVTDEIRELRRDLMEMQREYNQKVVTVRFVDAWLTGLCEKDRWLVTEQVIEGKYWREITIGWARKFGEQYGKDHIRKLRAQALEKIYRMAT